MHGTRAALALAARVGASCDYVNGEAAAREAAVIAASGGMFILPGEARRRADMIVFVGEIPESHRAYVEELAISVPDLATGGKRGLFLIGADRGAPKRLGGREVTLLSCEGTDLAGTLAAVRALCAGRKVTAEVTNIDGFKGALAEAGFPVFLFGGGEADGLTLEMLQGLVSDINRRKRASTLHLPASEKAWGAALTSTWTTGFPLRTGFSRGYPEHDPWRWNAGRMLDAGEADLHLWLSATGGEAPPAAAGASLIAVAKTARPAVGADVTIAVGDPGLDHDAVSYSVRTGTLAAVAARSSSQLPAAAVLRAIIAHLPEGAEAPC
ncbi:tungsten formylmethanofuran dehydrogenase [Aquamicrobium sp. LC103]|uniref:tungsten formylmethanofuran dehydrogenase n=1 Tax=Aquamicrobium sp. LC103 TaxID=1120658 RepID=UPI001FF0027B|nr:tungsten formylmethanofuran dehydrogenase [Aquamicrobium sp. LC103]